jgi:hypothetical protein
MTCRSTVPCGIRFGETHLDAYNGYSEQERNRKYQEYKRLVKLGQAVLNRPPCQLCGDPTVEVEPHTEDYSLPYRWLPPAEYMICRFCHGWLHKRFGKHRDDWLDFKSHVRRGGYGAEFASPMVRPERQEAARCRAGGLEYVWKVSLGRTPRNGQDWWEQLTTCEESKAALASRPRP